MIRVLIFAFFIWLTILASQKVTSGHYGPAGWLILFLLGVFLLVIAIDFTLEHVVPPRGEPRKKKQYPEPRQRK